MIFVFCLFINHYLVTDFYYVFKLNGSFFDYIFYIFLILLIALKLFNHITKMFSIAKHPK